MKANENTLTEAFIELMRPLLMPIVSEAVASALDKESRPHYPEKVNVAQASEITGYSVNSLYQMHSRGTVPGAFKVGGKLVFDSETLRNWVTKGART